MAEAVYFAVERTPTGERPALYHDHLPRRLSATTAQRDGLIYVVRMDTLPNGARWCAMSLADLYAAYLVARDGGRLPASNVVVAKPGGGAAERKVGHRERFHAPWRQGRSRTV